MATIDTQREEATASSLCALIFFYLRVVPLAKPDITRVGYKPPIQLAKLAGDVQSLKSKSVLWKLRLSFLV
jgi:hypothetical protein